MKDKWEIFKEVQNFGFQFVIVGKLFEDDRVDDDFLKELVTSGEDLQNCFVFIEAFDRSLSSNLKSPSLGKFDSIYIYVIMIFIPLIFPNHRVDQDEINWIVKSSSGDGHCQK